MVFQTKEDQRAFEARILRENYGLAVHLARRYNSDIPLEDRIQEALSGLLRAIRKFDPKHARANFKACATWWIRQALWRMNRQKSGTYTLPTAVWQRIYAGDWEATAYWLRAAPLDVDIKETPLEDSRVDIERTVFHRIDVRVFMRLICELLTPREREILICYYGLGGKKRESSQKISVRLGVSRERVRQLRMMAIDKLRPSMRKAELFGSGRDYANGTEGGEAEGPADVDPAGGSRGWPADPIPE